MDHANKLGSYSGKHSRCVIGFGIWRNKYGIPKKETLYIGHKGGRWQWTFVK